MLVKPRPKVENQKKFFDRLRPLYAPSILLLIRLAYMLAKYGHRAQTRKEQGPDGNLLRYFEHLRRVALILIDELHWTDHLMIITAILHDAVEDTRELTLDMIEHCFGPVVAGWVARCSKKPKRGFMHRLMTFAPWQVLAIKACDRLDNLRALHAGSLAFQHKQISETEDKYFALLDRLVEIAPPEFNTNAKYQVSLAYFLNQK